MPHVGMRKEQAGRFAGWARTSARSRWRLLVAAGSWRSCWLALVDAAGVSNDDAGEDVQGDLLILAVGVHPDQAPGMQSIPSRRLG
jgi:hypothetical protein